MHTRKRFAVFTRSYEDEGFHAQERPDDDGACDEEKRSLCGAAIHAKWRPEKLPGKIREGMFSRCIAFFCVCARLNFDPPLQFLEIMNFWQNPPKGNKVREILKIR